MTNEGIDIKKKIVRILGNFAFSDPIRKRLTREICRLISRTRAETEAVVTKRERKRCAEIANKKIDPEWPSDDLSQQAETIRNAILKPDILAAYKSNDAGEKP